MRIRQGWSGQVSSTPDRWAKFDIELEEDDLRRLLAALPGYPAATMCILPTGVVFHLLEIEAEILVYTKLMLSYGYPAAEAQAKLTELRGRKAATLDKIREITSQ